MERVVVIESTFMKTAFLPLVLLATLVATAACRTEDPKPEPKSEPAAPATASAKSATQESAPKAEASAEAKPTGKLVLGTPISGGEKATLTAVAKAPASYEGKTIVTEGTVTAVCQHMGCWMELKDESGEAHVKMAGHSFFVPKTASGKKARVAGKLAQVPEGAACGGGHQGGAGCKAEAEKQLGRPLAKLELEATGVELLD
jgi:Rieske Fe-S protein